MVETAAGEFRPSPAYDILCSKAVIPREADSALTLHGRANRIERSDFERFAENLQIPPKAMASIWEGFQAAASMMLDAVPRSRPSPELRASLRQVLQERQHRLFGQVAMG